MTRRGPWRCACTEEELSYTWRKLYRGGPHPIVGAIDHNPPQGVMLLDEKK